MKARLDLIKGWDGSADMDNRAAALAILSGQRAMGSQINTETTLEKKQEALKTTAALLQKARYGRIDPKWSEVSKIKRGDYSWPTNGGPDTLRAVYARGDLSKDAFLTGAASDTYIVIADWGAGWNLHPRHHPPVRLGHDQRRPRRTMPTSRRSSPPSSSSARR